MRMPKITIERKHDGGARLSAMHRGHLVTRTYYGYTKLDCIMLFRNALKKMENRNA